MWGVTTLLAFVVEETHIKNYNKFKSSTNVITQHVIHIIKISRYFVMETKLIDNYIKCFLFRITKKQNILLKQLYPRIEIEIV